MLASVRRLLPPLLLDRVAARLPQLTRLLKAVDAVDTEFHYRFRRRQMLDDVRRAGSVPRNLHVEGTNACNAACVFCAYPQMQRPKDTMDVGLFERVVDEYVSRGGSIVSLTPIVGDPFLDRHLFERLDFLAARSEIRGFYFYTNVLLLRPAFAERLLAYGRRLHIYVSLGGLDQDTYRRIMGVDGFEVVRRNLTALIEAKAAGGGTLRLTLALRCPESSWRGSFWDECVRWRQRGLVEIKATTAFDSWAGKVSEEELRAAGLRPEPPPYKRGACELLFAKPVVLADGRVNACACRDVDAELLVGDVREQSLAEIWQGPALAELIERHERGDYPEVCRSCTWYNSIYNSRRRQVHMGRGEFGIES